MSQRPLGFGIWGTGMIAEFHAKALAETPEALLANPEVDIVCLCTPSGDHLAPALVCAKAGKRVVNGAEGRKAVEPILALYQSAQNADRRWTYRSGETPR